jgi:hypothetical protein
MICVLKKTQIQHSLLDYIVLFFQYLSELSESYYNTN